MTPREMAMACTVGVLITGVLTGDRRVSLVAVVLAVMLVEGPEAVTRR